MAGLALIAIDIFLLPGGTIGFLGFAMMVFACYQAYNVLGRTTGHVFVAFTGLSCIVFVYYILKPQTWNRVSVRNEISGKVNTDDMMRIKPGDTGKTISVLRPSGNAVFNGHIAEVTTREPMIPSQTDIRVVEIEDNKIYVQIL